jgi:broad specificity phosphatase PhoE
MRLLRAALACLVLAAAPVRAQAPAGSTTIIVVRHAEKEAEPAADPSLSAAGSARAEALAAALKDAHVTAVISTQFARTRLTAAPTATMAGRTVEQSDARAPDHVAVLASSLFAAHRGETVLVVGHSNTVPAIVAALGAPRPAAICDAEYDNMYVVTVPPAGPATVVHAKYGAASPADATCPAMK